METNTYIKHLEASYLSVDLYANLGTMKDGFRLFHRPKFEESLMRTINNKIKIKTERSFRKEEALEKKKIKEEKKVDWRYAKCAIFSLIIKTVSQDDRRTYK